MVTPQQHADEALAEWQRLRSLSPEDRIAHLTAKEAGPPAADLAYAIERFMTEIIGHA